MSKKYLQTFFGEKDGTTHFTNSYIVKKVLLSCQNKEEQNEIANIIRKIDSKNGNINFKNGNINYFLKHLAAGLAKNY